MSTMPTPASTFSAYGRRRHILQNRPSASVIKPTAKVPLTTQQPPNRTIWRTPNAPTLPPLLFNKLSPFLTFSETVVLQSFLLTLAIILLTLLLNPLISLPALLLNRCHPVPPIPTHPFTSISLRILSLPLLTLSLATRKLLARTPNNTTQAFGTTVTAILQTSLLNYVAFGSIPPYHYLITACVPSTAPLFPSWPDLLPQIFHSAVAALLYHLLTRYASPPPSSLPYRSITRSLALPAIPSILATLPMLVIPTFSLVIGYSSFLRSLGAVNVAFVTTFVTLLSWNIQTSMREKGAITSTPEVESDRLAHLIREDAPTSVILPSLNTITKSYHVLHHFPGYSDATGSAWRALLAHCLHPFLSIRKALQSRPAPTLFASSTPAWRIVLPPEEVNHAITACASLATVYEECVQADTFGVVHRTLPYALAELLRCKLDTASFVAEGGTELGENIRKWVHVCSGRDMVVAVDDALTVCIYRIVGAFKGHLETYIRGAEVEWDRGLNGLLKAFLEYQVP